MNNDTHNIRVANQVIDNIGSTKPNKQARHTSVTSMKKAMIIQTIIFILFDVIIYYVLC